MCYNVEFNDMTSQKIYQFLCLHGIINSSTVMFNEDYNGCFHKKFYRTQYKIAYLSASSKTNHLTLDIDKLSVCCKWSNNLPGVATKMFIPLRNLQIKLYSHCQYFLENSIFVLKMMVCIIKSNSDRGFWFFLQQNYSLKMEKSY